MRTRTLAFLAALATLTGAPLLLAQAPTLPQTLQPNVVLGRLGIGPGPVQPIPFGTLFGNLFNGGSAPAAHGVLIGEGGSPLNSVVLSDAQLLIGQTGADPAGAAISGDATLADTGALTIAAGAVTNAKQASMANLTFKCNTSGGAASPSDCTVASFASLSCPPSVTIQTTGTAATFTLPTCNGAQPFFMEIDVVGGGASAPGSGTGPGVGVAGNLSSFVYNSVTYTANGGNTGTAGNNQAGGTGGTASGCDENIPGGQGSPSQSASAAGPGSLGGGTTLAPGGAGGVGSANGNAGATNTGAGGGSGGTGAVATAPGAGGGATCRKLITVVNGQTTATYTVGAATTGGAAGTSGGQGGGGAAGRVRIVSRWQ